MYELFGVLSHKGSMRGGHYVAYVRCQDSWFKCDDAYITRVDQRTVSQAQAYMLFYAQQLYY